jgi:hypothetical protein
VIIGEQSAEEFKELGGQNYCISVEEEENAKDIFRSPIKLQDIYERQGGRMLSRLILYHFRTPLLYLELYLYSSPPCSSGSMMNDDFSLFSSLLSFFYLHFLFLLSSQFISST